MADVPKGVWFEERRKRYRVRLYIGPVCVYRSYHKDLPTAIKAYWTAKVKQASTILPKPKANEGLSNNDLLNMLKT